jgi:hypothetical protein
MSTPVNVMAMSNDAERKRAARRTAMWLAALAAAFYLGFIVMSIVRASH